MAGIIINPRSLLFVCTLLFCGLITSAQNSDKIVPTAELTKNPTIKEKQSAPDKQFGNKEKVVTAKLTKNPQASKTPAKANETTVPTVALTRNPAAKE